MRGLYEISYKQPNNDVFEAMVVRKNVQKEPRPAYAVFDPCLGAPSSICCIRSVPWSSVPGTAAKRQLWPPKDGDSRLRLTCRFANH